MIKNKIRSLFHFIKAHKIWSVVIGLVIIGIAWYIISGGKSAVPPTFVLAERGNIKEIVSVTGNVKPLSDVSLAFERGGRMANINVAVGDKVYTGQTLASVSNADLVANLDQAKANLKKVQAGLGDNAEQTSLSFFQAENSLVNSIKDSYTKADDALRNKIYSLFTDAVKYNARLSFTTDTSLQEDIEDGKDNMVDSLDSWYRTLNKTNISTNLEINYNVAKTNLTSLKSLLDKCAEAVNGLSAGDVTQTQIDTWKTGISTARTNINTAIDTLVASYNNYTSAGLSLKISKNSTLSEEAGIDQAKAGVASAEAELAKTIITAPISGVITSVDAKAGEMVQTAKNIISVISYGDYEVESFVPEADIAKVNLGDLASTTLDAYRNTVNFDTKVIKIDPAATVIDGVPTYKVTSKFINQDSRIKSGMTANLDILTAEKEGVLIVPARAVITDGDKFVEILNIDKTTSEIKVEVGLRGSDGMVEIISGLKVGDKVVTSL